MSDKCKIVPILNETLCHEGVRANKGVTIFLTSLIYWVDKLASRLCCFIPSKTADTGLWEVGPIHTLRVCLVRPENEEAKWSVALPRENCCGTCVRRILQCLTCTRHAAAHTDQHPRKPWAECLLKGLYVVIYGRLLLPMCWLLIFLEGVFTT
jgi:hypothetical protein